MPEMVVRKCNCCKETIEIHKNNIVDIVLYKKLYYHKSCFCDIATKRSQSKKGKPEEWKNALDNAISLENDAKQTLQNYFAKDDLNEWLLENYDITAVPKTFWQTVADLENGVYKKKRCKPVNTEILCGTWKWGQKRLNNIAAKNKANRKGPNNDTDRLAYDLAILLRHIEDYVKYISTTKDEKAEITSMAQNASKIDYEKIYKESKKEDKSNSILDLMNDIF